MDTDDLRREAEWYRRDRPTSGKDTIIVLELAASEIDRLREIISAGHDYLRDALGLAEDAPKRFDFYAEQCRRLTALCDGYRGEVERLKGITSTQDMVCAECREISGETALAALTRARAEVMEFEKAKAQISGDRLGSYTLCGQWTLTADLTTEEIENSHYRTALERGRAEGMELAAQIAESEPRVWDTGAPDPQHRIAAAIRSVAKGEQ